jgi:hypothetical protein
MTLLVATGGRNRDVVFQAGRGVAEQVAEQRLRLECLRQRVDDSVAGVEPPEDLLAPGAPALAG